MSSVVMLRVDSSSIEAVGYDSDARELHVTFTGGRTYAYANVPARKVHELMAAESKGGYVNREVRPHHPVREV